MYYECFRPVFLFLGKKQRRSQSHVPDQDMDPDLKADWVEARALHKGQKPRFQAPAKQPSTGSSSSAVPSKSRKERMNKYLACLVTKNAAIVVVMSQNQNYIYMAVMFTRKNHQRQLVPPTPARTLLWQTVTVVCVCVCVLSNLS